MRLEPITAANWRAAGALRVAAGQLELVAEYEPIAFYILARSYIGFEGGVWHPLAVYAPDLVGVMALVDEGETWAMRSFMIGANHQGGGLGRAAVVEAISFVRSLGARSLRLTVHPANAAGIHLYESLVFEYAEPRDGNLGMVLAL